MTAVPVKAPGLGLCGEIGGDPRSWVCFSSKVARTCCWVSLGRIRERGESGGFICFWLGKLGEWCSFQTWERQKKKQVCREEK